MNYYPKYIVSEDVTEEWADWLARVESASDEPSELETITDVCASAKCKAILYDAAGFVRGYVSPDGSYRLQ